MKFFWWFGLLLCLTLLAYGLGSLVAAVVLLWRGEWGQGLFFFGFGLVCLIGAWLRAGLYYGPLSGGRWS